MRIIVTSDTHGRHDQLGVLAGDLLIHCGDVENLFEPGENAVDSIDAWFATHDVEHVLCIGGNHDRELERRWLDRQEAFQNAIYLQDSAFECRGVKFYGTPWVPELKGHAFYGADRTLVQAWANIPDDVEVLITHTPPAGVLDESSGGQSLGCEYLAERLEEISPALHCFGHVHASSGVLRRDRTTHVNASAVKGNYEIRVAPFVFDRDATGEWHQA